jgi:hypothetical protein
MTDLNSSVGETRNKSEYVYVGGAWLKRPGLTIKPKEQVKVDKPINIVALLAWLGIIATVLAVLLSGCDMAWAYTDEQIANAIYLAEGGAKTSHPYGILKKYKTTTPRQACINTIRHAKKDWDGKGDFVAFLGSRYCPVGASNDPMGLNVNWVRNVNYFLERI